MKYFTLLLLVCLGLTSCDDDDQIELPADSLAAYLSVNPDSQVVRDSLIACAASAADTNVELPLSIFFLPEGNATNFRYYETKNIAVDNTDFTKYAEVKLETEPVFNGYLRRFPRSAISQNLWAIVTFEKDGNIHLSNPIRLKYNDLPTEYNSELLNIDQSESISPLFTWQDGMITENEIYFQVLSNANGDLLSGTYTYERNFRFYDVSNVVLNIRDVSPAPSLQIGEEYNFLLMAVSVDNWVNLIIEESFLVE